MVGPPSISPRLADEFFQAVREYVRWAFSFPEQPLSFERYIQLSLVCGRVASFTDPLPEDVFNALYVLAIGDTHKLLKDELSADPKYVSAALCFLELIESKKRKIEKSNETRDCET
jgi:hypothetical protein